MSKKKWITIAIAVVVVLGLIKCSCGGGGKEEKVFDVTVDNTVIGGKLSEYFSLVDKTYKYDCSSVTVELKCIKPLPDSLKTRIGLEVLDKDGTVVAQTSDINKYDECDALRQAAPGQTVSIKLYCDIDYEKYEPAKIRLASTIEEVEEAQPTETTSSAAADEEEEEATSSSGSSDWDALLDSYEEYVDEYISFMKKAAKGDASAMSKYPELLQKAQEYADKLANAQGDLSAAQMARMNKIAQKMASAASNM